LPINIVREPTLLLKNLANQEYYSGELDITYFNKDDLKINKGFNIYIAAVSESVVPGTDYSKVDIDKVISNISTTDFVLKSEYSNYHSEWSAVAVKYAIPEISFPMFGGLTKEEFSQAPNVKFDNKLLVNNNPFLYLYDAYRIKGMLEFKDLPTDIAYGDTEFYDFSDPIGENDTLLWY